MGINSGIVVLNFIFMLMEKQSDSEESLIWEKEETATGVRFLSKGVVLAVSILVMEMD